ncbi:5'-3' exonuclease [Pseudohalioglobus lutimaris]|nr:5'-3' exonuclease H3TH domain-containing protein [Pseudohalioglobus lutimaris]
MRQRAWLLDASIYIFRAWFSLPDRWHTADGMPLNAVYGYAGFLCDFIAQTRKGDWVTAAFDESLGTGFRHQLYPLYKSSRELPDAALAFQLRTCRRLTELSGVSCYGGPGYEADDYLASLAALAKARDLPVTVLTRDKDLGQLLQDDQDSWWDFAADQRLDIVAFTERFGVRPDQFADYLALVGDRIDDIPGVPGVGPRTAALLLQHFGDIETLWRQLDSVAGIPVRGAAKLADKLSAHREQIHLSRQLATLEAAIPAMAPAQPFAPGPQASEQVIAYLEALNIKGPLLQRWRRLQGEMACAS